MKIRIALLLSTLFILTLISCNVNKGTKDLNGIVASQIDSIRIAHHIPSIAYGVIRNDNVLVINAVGYRDIQSKEKAQSEDYYHIGSNTKAFTGFLAAKLVEDNVIEWDTKFFDLYPELKNESDSAYYDITLKELLSHRARLINFKEPAEIIMVLNNYDINHEDSLTLLEKRYFLIEEVLKYEQLPPYEECDDSYSNAGYIAAALMLEKATGQSWEILMTELSNDLNLGIHIGSPIDLGTHQPKGHLNPNHLGLEINEDLIPILTPIQIPNQDELSQLDVLFEFLLLCTPAGNTSMTVDDFLKFLQLNINGVNGENNYLKAETYQQIFSTYPYYSMGWGVEPNETLKYSHRGSNMMFNSFAGISPDEKLGIVIMINAYNNDALTAVLQLLEKNYGCQQTLKIKRGEK